MVVDGLDASTQHVFEVQLPRQKPRIADAERDCRTAALIHPFKQCQVNTAAPIAERQRTAIGRPENQIWNPLQSQHTCVPGFCCGTVSDEDVDVIDAVEVRCHLKTSDGRTQLAVGICSSLGSSTGQSRM